MAVNSRETPGAAVYRIAQEALTNVVRHAPRAQATVTIHTSPDRVTVDVHDDGPGAAPEAARRYGLVGICERVERLGGQVTSPLPIRGGSGSAR